MEKINFLKGLVVELLNPENPSIKLSLNNVHAQGIFSLVVKNTEFGKLTRIFIADRKLKPYEVQLHSHRYSIRLTTIKGTIKHHIANLTDDISSSSMNMALYEYRSYLNGGNGLKYKKDVNVVINEFSIPIGSSIFMKSSDFHTMSVSKGSIWIVEEQGFEVDSSFVLGVPFVTEELYNEPAMFQINDKIQLVVRELKKLIQEYELV